MTQVLPRYCPRCGAPIVTKSDVCTTCGLPLEDLLSRDENTMQEQLNRDQESLPQIDQQVMQEAHPKQDELDKVPTVQLNPQSSTRSFITKDLQMYPKSSPQKKRKIGRRELLIVLVISLLVLGTVVYAVAGSLGLPLPGFVNVQPSITTTAINASVPYAGVDITLLNVQQSQSFLNDPNSNSNGMVRLNLQERNATNIKVVWSYATIAHVMLPNKTLVSPSYINSVVRVAPGAMQKSVIDFAVPMNISLNRLTFVVGATNEAQMLIPLVKNANVSKYQPKTTNVNGQMLYFGLNWTLTTATSSWSVPGKQAAKGMRYATLTLKVDNTLSQIAITGSPYEYMRLQYGNKYAQPDQSTVPVAFQVGAAGVTGIVSFEVPQQATTLTLILLPQKEDNGDQSSTAFHLS